MSETAKLRALLDEYAGYKQARDWGRTQPDEMLTRIQAQSVLALEEQLDRQHGRVPGPPVPCPVCEGLGHVAGVKCRFCAGRGLVVEI